MQYIICKWKIYLALPEKRERDPREHPFKRNMVASDPDGMVKALGSRDAPSKRNMVASDPDGMVKALGSRDAPSKRNLVEGAQKGARRFVNEEKNLRMRDARTRLGLSQTDLAERVGATRQTIGLIEAGRYNPSLKLCTAICKTLGVTLNDLFWNEDVAS